MATDSGKGKRKRGLPKRTGRRGTGGARHGKLLGLHPSRNPRSKARPSYGVYDNLGNRVNG